MIGFGPATLIGFFLGFAFGVGCALAVMYSVFTGGYRAAIRDTLRPQPTPRLLHTRAHLERKNQP